MLAVMRLWLCLFLLCLGGDLWSQEDHPGQLPIFSEGERLFDEGSYAMALKVYDSFAEDVSFGQSLEVPYWIRFRRLDCEWRALAGSRQVDSSLTERIWSDFDRLLAEFQTFDASENFPQMTAIMAESAGDYWWMPRNRRDFGRAWMYYEKALETWASSPDLELAREHYLGIVWKMTHSPEWNQNFSSAFHGNAIPVSILENAIKIASSREDIAHANFLLAQLLRNRLNQSPYMHERVVRAFETSTSGSTKHEWLDDALMQYGNWLASQGKPIKEKNGHWRFVPDYPSAVKEWRRLMDIYGEEETRFYRQVKSRIEDVTGKQLEIMASHAFIPGSKIRLHTSWRNIRRFQVKLFKVDLLKNIHLEEGGLNPGEWIKTIRTPELNSVYQQAVETADKGEHEHGRQDIVLDTTPEDGAYLAVAYIDGEEESRELILISRLTVMARASANRTLVWICDSVDGRPLPGAEVKLWQRVHQNRQWSYKTFNRKANDQGLVVFEDLGDFSSMEWLATARHENQQNLSHFSNPRSNAYIQPWKIYAFTDRPVYRPEDEVRWKVIIRNQTSKGFRTPDSEQVKIRILDPKRSAVLEEKVTLNSFGTAAGQWQPTTDSPLGMYRVECLSSDDKRIGSAELFRLEEYKRPEMKLAIDVPMQNEERAKPFRPGDRVKLEAHAEYYFGGDVVGADVEVRVYRKPFHFYFPRPRPFPWLEESYQRSFSTRDSSTGILDHEFKLKTDALGKVQIEFDTLPDLSSDLSYRVEVRLTDSSRREVVAEHEVRVARQGHFASVELKRQMVRPGEKMTFDVQVLDVNEQPVRLEGQVKVLKKVWDEVWWTPEGVEIEGAALAEVKRRYKFFPPPPDRSDQRPWRIRKRGYKDVLVQSQTARTDEKGLAQITFTPDRTGYYSVVWTSEDHREGALKGPGNEVRSEKSFWVSSPDVTELGYHSNGVEIIVDQDTFHSGQTTPVMISVPATDRWVLLTVESDRMIEHRIIHVKGTVRMVSLDIGSAHVPNFYIQAMMVSDHKIHVDSERIIVPPVQNFLNVEVESEKASYGPREKVSLDVRVTDHSGEPVEGEVSVAVYDKSITYIQNEIAGDPREVFYGERRPLVSLQGGHWRSFEKLIELEDGTLLDEASYQYLIENGLSSNQLEGDALWFHLRDYSPEGFHVDALTGLPPNFSGGLGGGGLGGGGLGGGGGFARQMTSSPTSMRMFKAASASAQPASAVAGYASDFDFSSVDTSQVEVRHNFNATALWEPNLHTDATGRGKIDFELPDTLTDWKIDARGIDANTKVGRGSGNFVTRRPLLIRLQTPRFLVMGDKVVLSAIVNNQTDSDIRAQISLTSDQLNLNDSSDPKQIAIIPANGEYRVDWPNLTALKPGEITLKGMVVTEHDSDAVELSLVVHERGQEQFLAWTGKSNQESITIPVEFPKQRKTDSTRLTVQVTPSLAVTMLDALPYLIDYPYGCTEQTMSRFLPAAIVKRTLEKVGLSVSDLKPGTYGGLNPELVEFTHRSGFEALQEVDNVTRAGLKRLSDMQHEGGGWGWWKDGLSDPFMSAYVVWGLSLVQEAGVDFDQAILDKARNYLAKIIIQYENRLDMQSWMLHAVHASGVKKLDKNLSEAIEVAWENLWGQRDALNAYSRSLLALSAHYAGKSDAASVLIRNLENGVIRGNASQKSRLQTGTLIGSSAATAHWGEDGIYYRWSEGGVEATAMALKAIMAVDPDHELVEPVVRWLINNRRGAHWSNTRDTAMTLLVLSDYLKVSGELQSELQYEVYAGEKLIAAERVTKENILKAPSRYSIPSSLIEDKTDIRIVRTGGNAPYYYGIESTWYSLENPIPAAGNELFVRRDYFRLDEVPTLLKGTVLERAPIMEGEELRSGDRVEVVLTLESRNHYEYLLIEDLKPAGLEAVELRSGGRAMARQLSQREIERLETEGRNSVKHNASWRFTGKVRSMHQEWRDRKVALFIDKLPEGVWEIRYTLRAEVPGHFNAMPTLGHAMYIPEIRGNSRGQIIEVMDRDSN